MDKKFLSKRVKLLITMLICITSTLVSSMYTFNFAALSNNTKMFLDESKDARPIAFISNRSDVADTVLRIVDEHVVERQEKETSLGARISQVVKGIGRGSNKEEGLEITVRAYNATNARELNKVKEELVLIDSSVMNDKVVKEKAQNLFQNGSRVAFRKNDLTRAEVEELLAIDKKTYDGPAPDYTRPEEDITTCIGWVAYKNFDGTVMFNEINRLIIDDEQENLESMILSLRSRAAERAKLEEIKERVSNIVTLNGVNASPHPWPEVEYTAFTWHYPQGTVKMMGRIYKSPFNPMTHNKYHFFVKNYTEVTPNRSGSKKYVIENVRLGVSGDGYGQILEDWSPKDSQSAWQINLSVPGGLTGTYEIGETVRNTLVGGGFLDKYTLIEFQPIRWGGKIHSKSTMTLVSSAYMLQDPSNCYVFNGVPYPHYYRGKTSATTIFKEDVRVGYSNPVTYYNFRIPNGY